MDFTTKKALNDIARLVNGMETTREKTIFLNELWADIDQFNHTVKEHGKYVSREALKRFFGKHSKYNNRVYLSQQTEGLWDVFYCCIPLCSVDVSSGTATFYNMDSIKEETERVLDNMQTDIRQHENYLNNVRRMAGRNTFTLFIREMLAGVVSISKVREFRNHMNSVADEVVVQIGQMKENLASATKKADGFVADMNEIASYLYKGFEVEGYECQLEDIEKMKYDFKMSLASHPYHHQDKNKEVVIKESSASDNLVKELPVVIEPKN